MIIEQFCILLLHRFRGHVNLGEESQTHPPPGTYLTENTDKWYLRFVSDGTFYLTQRPVRKSDTLIGGYT